MKILISAYSCEPGRGSEPGVGWNMAKQIAGHHEVWVLTRPDESKSIIEAELALNPVPNLKFVYFNLPIIGGLWRLNQSGAMQIHYYFWQIQAYFVARELYKTIRFDLIHHITFVRYSNPSFLSLLPIPFIWGPVGGGETTPPQFWKDFSWENKVYEALRLAWRTIGEIDPFTAMTARRSSIAYSTTEDTAKRLRALGATNVKISGESGLFDEDIHQLSQSPPPNYSPVRFISIARLLHWKGFHLGLRAFAQANLPDAEYWILGDGPEYDRLKNLAIELGIAEQVKLWGKLPRDQVLEKLADCTALVHPSLHDSGGWVCLEAMAAGRPVICLDLGGPAEQVTNETGFKAPVGDPEDSINAMAEAMVALASQPELALQMGKAGQKQVQTLYSWSAKGQYLDKVYQHLIDANSSWNKA